MYKIIIKLLIVVFIINPLLATTVDNTSESIYNPTYALDMLEKKATYNEYPLVDRIFTVAGNALVITGVASFAKVNQALLTGNDGMVLPIFGLIAYPLLVIIDVVSVAGIVMAVLPAPQTTEYYLYQDIQKLNTTEEQEAKAQDYFKERADKEISKNTSDKTVTQLGEVALVYICSQAPAAPVSIGMGIFCIYDFFTRQRVVGPDEIIYQQILDNNNNIKS